MHMNLDAVGSQYRHCFRCVPLIARIKWAIERANVKDRS